MGVLSKHLNVPEYDQFFRQSNLPKWFNSERLNFFRFGFILTIIFIVIFQKLIGIQYFNNLYLFVGALIVFLMIPKKPYPLYYLIVLYSRRHFQEMSEEVYQLYNEIKSHFYNRNYNNLNTYHIVLESIPYYKKLKPTLEKMLPLLEEKKHLEAWVLFETELNIKEATILRIVMEEIESLEIQQALELLEQKKDEIKSEIYNRYEDYLFRRSTLINVVATGAAFSVFLNEVVVFYTWYKETMAAVL